MMKKILACLFILTALSCNKKRTSEPVGMVFKSIKLERYAVQNANPDSTTLSSYIIKEFDEAGLETKSTYYNQNNVVLMQFVNQYENGNKVKVDWISGQNEPVQYVKMSYDENNRLLKSETFDLNNVFKSGYLHRWKEDGRLEEKGPITENGEFKPNAFYRYNEHQEFESLEEYDENDSLYGIFNWKYVKYDMNDEWVERYMILDDTLVRVEKRQISYQNE